MGFLGWLAVGAGALVLFGLWRFFRAFGSHMRAFNKLGLSDNQGSAMAILTNWWEVQTRQRVGDDERLAFAAGVARLGERFATAVLWKRLDEKSAVDLVLTVMGSFAPWDMSVAKSSEVNAFDLSRLTEEQTRALAQIKTWFGEYGKPMPAEKNVGAMLHRMGTGYARGVAEGILDRDTGLLLLHRAMTNLQFDTTEWRETSA